MTKDHQRSFPAKADEAADTVREEEIRHLCVQWMTVPNLPVNAIPASPDDVMWLLGEVTRYRSLAVAATERADRIAALAQRCPNSVSDAAVNLLLAEIRASDGSGDTEAAS